MTKTENYNLNQWAAEDPIRRTDFNEDNAKIDAALHELEQGKAEADGLAALQTVVSGKAQAADLTALQKTVAGKADASTVTTLQTTVAGKAEAADLAALQTVVNGKAEVSALTALQNTVAGKGNCKIEYGSYVGKGVQLGTVSLTFSFSPKLVVVSAGTFGVMVRGADMVSFPGSFSCFASLQWQEYGVSWSNSRSTVNASDYLNGGGITYYYVAFG